MRISDFVNDIYCSYELRNKPVETIKRTCDSSNDAQNNSSVSIVINIDLSDIRQTDKDDENTRKLYRKFYRANSY